MTKPQILILGNMTKEGVADLIESLREWFETCAEILGVFPHDGFPLDLAAPAKLCIVFGGDGSLLSAGRSLAPLGVPLLGVNMGKLGFLADYDVQHLKKHLAEMLAGQIQPVDRIMLSVLVHGCDGKRVTEPVRLASNDIAISAGDPFRMIDLNVAQGEQHVARYLGDGVVISTPTGSTGYNLSAGGPILDPALDAVAITPIAPHTLSLRPIIVRAEEPILITAIRVNEGTKMVIDGQIPCKLCDGQVVEVRRAEKPLRLIPHPGRDFFQTLSNKLHWGRSPHH